MADAGDYQSKLLEHVSVIPTFPETLNSGVPNDKDKGNAEFARLAGMTHAALIADWKSGKATTTCNSFLSSCGVAMGYKGGIAISSFNIAENLAAAGLSHCWVLPDSGAEPECGDIFRLLGNEPDHNGVRKNHMGIVLAVKDGNWFTVEGGQGGKSGGCDKLCKKQYTGRPGDLRGWASMKAMLNADKPLPYWLGGWWEVEEDPYYTWYYYFGANGKVLGTDRQPVSALAPPANPRFAGTFHEKGMFRAQLSWLDESVDEDITFFIDTDRQRRKDTLGGKTAKGMKLTGKRL